MRKHRILVMAHGHPDFSLGGGEIAAHNLFKAYRENLEVEDAWFLARADRNRGATGAISLRAENEYLWEQAVHDWHMMKAVHQDSLTTWFADLIRALRPTVVHTHHYAHFGLEYLRVIKQVDPSIRIVMTLHEYMAICRNNGQMVKTGDFKLCSRATHDECARCFPTVSPEDFWMRKHYFQRHFELVDHFVSPSAFLKRRYADWGLDPSKISVLENGMLPVEPLPPRPLANGDSRNRFGFFGQINPYKGLDVLLKALAQLPWRAQGKVILEVHGANLEIQSEAYRESIRTLLEPLVKNGAVEWYGPYQPHELRSRLAGVDWVVVPSIWWENSPMVIQESLNYGRPLVVSDIGGMAEKVRDGVDGRHVPSGNAAAWARTLSELATGDEWTRLKSGISPVTTCARSAEAHVDLLAGLH